MNQGKENPKPEGDSTMTENMSKAALETAIRNDILASITELLSEKFETDVLPVSASELAVPVLDAEGNEKFALVKVSIPRGSRNGAGGYDAYDGYAAAEDYKMDLEERAAKKAASAEKKAAAEREKERKREARKVVKELNKKGLKGMVEDAE
jgi:hypothetical protein